MGNTSHRTNHMESQISSQTKFFMTFGMCTPRIADSKWPKMINTPDKTPEYEHNCDPEVAGSNLGLLLI